MDKARIICCRSFFSTRVTASKICAANNVRLFVKSERYCTTIASGLKHNKAPIKSVECSRSTNHIDSLTAEEQKKLKVLKLEFDVFYSDGERLPSSVSDEDWVKILKTCPSVSSRRKYYNFLFKNEKAELNKRARAEANIKLQNEKKTKTQELIDQGLLENFKNTFMLFVYEESLRRFYYNNLFYAMMNGPTLVFDFDFEQYMSHLEIKDLMKQIHQCHGLNKVAKEPFHFHFCNLLQNSESYSRLQKSIPNIDRSPITVSEDSYLNHYPKERLVYLSPNAPKVLTALDPNDVYIIGCIVDKSNEIPRTMAKSKQEGIRMASFPMDRFVKWMQGSKALPLNQVVDLMLKVKETEDWKHALVSSLPSRKFVTVEEESQLRNKKKFPKKQRGPLIREFKK